MNIRNFNLQKSVYITNCLKKYFTETNLKGYINYVRKHGHKIANTNPLNFGLISKNDESPILKDEKFDPQSWCLSSIEKIEEFPIDNSSTFNESLLIKNVLIEDLKNYLDKNYLGKTGVEFDHIDNEEEKKWLYESYERLMSDVTNLELVNSFKLLYPADLFEKFLHTKFPTFKRYSGEGANSLLVLLYSILSEGSKISSKVQNAIIAMPHRGRLNILPLILDYPVRNLLSKIMGKRDMPKEIEGIDDVVSHVAVSNPKTYCLRGSLSDHKPIQVSLLHNPSHLEAINPVAMGKAYAKIKDNQNDRESVLNIVIHGDSAVSAQGIIYECLSFHKTPNCNLGGTVHIVTNNQIGYTTYNENSRSSKHPTDIFKAYEIPIVHANADDISSLIALGRLAYEYKQKFSKDFVIDLVCWRKYGHNEVDEPSFTQPLMYKIIKNKKETVLSLKDYLLEKNLISEETIKSLEERYNKILNDGFNMSKDPNFALKLEEVRDPNFKGNKSLTGKWKDLNFPQFAQKDSEIQTGIDKEIIQRVLNASVNIPKEFKLHDRLMKYFVNSRTSNLEKGLIDWPSAEMVAFGSLLQNGFNVRISGQDVTRGTFSQRHLGFFDQETNQVYYPLSDSSNFPESKGRLEANNSTLSEFGVMLFDYGYSWESPKNFVIWEAQFGDFVNGAQIAQDQFISSGEKKWMRQSGLTLLLPHGFDGTGPEHSSSKMERFLQLIDSNGINTLNDDVSDHRKINFCIAQPTRPSNYFHLLRRQMLRNYRKPLVVAVSKIGLKHSAYVSPIEEFSLEHKFTPIIVDKFNLQNDFSKLKGVIFCSGQIYMEINKIINDFNSKNNSPSNYIVIRIEELAPFPQNEIMNLFSNGLNQETKFYWVQEESANCGAFTYMTPHLRRIARKLTIKNNQVHYIGRPAQCGANGCVDEHKKEVEKLSQDIKNIII